MFVETLPSGKAIHPGQLTDEFTRLFSHASGDLRNRYLVAIHPMPGTQFLYAVTTAAGTTAALEMSLSLHRRSGRPELSLMQAFVVGLCDDPDCPGCDEVGTTGVIITAKLSHPASVN